MYIDIYICIYSYVYKYKCMYKCITYDLFSIHMTPHLRFRGIIIRELTFLLCSPHPTATHCNTLQQVKIYIEFGHTFPSHSLLQLPRTATATLATHCNCNNHTIFFSPLASHDRAVRAAAHCNTRKLYAATLLCNTAKNRTPSSGRWAFHDRAVRSSASPLPSHHSRKSAPEPFSIIHVVVSWLSRIFNMSTTSDNDHSRKSALRPFSIINETFSWFGSIFIMSHLTVQRAASLSLSSLSLSLSLFLYRENMGWLWFEGSLKL